MIRMNFRNDWKGFLEKEMISYGLQYDQVESLEDNTLRYLNAKRRTPRCTPRTVHESKELQIPPQHIVDYSHLKKLMQEGGNLGPYLSRDIQKGQADKNDPLLNTWGIQHLHFRSHPGTLDVLLVRITDTDVFVIQSFPHGRGHADTWVNSELLEIVHNNNWPEMELGEVKGVAAEPLTSNAKVSLRKRNVNFATATSDGTVYIAPGGGVTSSGRCFFDVCEKDKIFSELDSWQRWVEGHEDNFRTALGISASEDLSIKMMFGDQECWLYDPVRNKRFAITLAASK